MFHQQVDMYQAQQVEMYYNQHLGMYIQQPVTTMFQTQPMDMLIHPKPLVDLYSPVKIYSQEPKRDICNSVEMCYSQPIDMYQLHQLYEAYYPQPVPVVNPLFNGYQTTPTLPPRITDPNSIYESDEFRMYALKINKCPKTRSHDWTSCPFVHKGEKARRRDPQKYHYSSMLCPDYMDDGKCWYGDSCRFAHGVFEYWLHPERYRTRFCFEGDQCYRKVCFFAHSDSELRTVGWSPRRPSHYAPPRAIKEPVKTTASCTHATAAATNYGKITTAGSSKMLDSVNVNAAVAVEKPKQGFDREALNKIKGFTLYGADDGMLGESIWSSVNLPEHIEWGLL